MPWSTISITQETSYPNHGAIALSVSPEGVSEFTLSLRVPGWARKAAVTVNGTGVDAELRVNMRIEIAKLHEQLGNSMI